MYGISKLNATWIWATSVYNSTPYYQDVTVDHGYYACEICTFLDDGTEHWMCDYQISMYGIWFYLCSTAISSDVMSVREKNSLYLYAFK